MPHVLETLVKQLQESGLINSSSLDEFVGQQSSLLDACELLNQLKDQGQLTEFQARRISEGRLESLILGNYLLLDRLGGGGMGQVFKARHRRMDRTVALKVLRSDIASDAQAISRFEREARAAARLDHPHIVTAYDADQANGVHFLVMEHIDGIDLATLVKKNGPLSPQLAVRYVLQAARGLEYAHGQGVVHRDIKPGNLLLDRKENLQILDFGLARVYAGGESPTQSELTGTGTVMGTIDFMAPEQAVSPKHADARADIYSLGCTLYFLLVGKPPYDGDTSIARLLAHRDQAIPKLPSALSGATGQLESTFRQMVAKDPATRLQSMSEIIVRLEQCEKNLQEAIVPPVKLVGKGIRFGSYLRMAAAAALFFALLAAAVYQLQTADGTLLVEVDQPDVFVEVFDEKGQIEIRRKGEKGALSIAVDPGKHRLRITKDGFQFFAKNFEMQAGGTATITAQLVPTDKATGTARPVLTTAASSGEHVASATPTANREIAAWVLANGGSVKILIPGEANEMVNQISDVAKLPSTDFSLQAIDFRKFRVLHDDDLIRLQVLPELTSLDFGPRVPTDAGMATIGKLDRLESLNLPAGLAISEKGLQLLQSLPRLHKLSLSARVLSPQDATTLASLPSLADLYVYGITSDQVLDQLSASKSLANLSLGPAASPTDKGLENLASFQHLVQLSFISTSVTDKGLEHLGRLRGLRSISFQAPGVTAAGVAALRASLPDCKVESISKQPIEQPGP